MKFFFISLISLLLSINLQAEDSKLNAKFFGTLGGVYNTNNNYLFTRGPNSKDGSSNDLNTFIDTVIGVQSTYTFNDDFSFLTQLIAKKNDYGDIKALIESAYVKYDSNENFIIKIGRIKLPYYRNSDNNNIGYSKLMLREPIEVYGLMPFNKYNGVEFIYSNIISDYFYTIQANYGQEQFDVPIQSLSTKLESDLKDMMAINLTFGNDIIEARTTYLSSEIYTENDILNSIFANVDYNLARKYEMKSKKAEYFGLGLFLDYNDFIIASEYGKRTLDSFYLNTHGFYTTFAYRMGAFIPYISYAKVMMKKDTKINSNFDNLNYLLEIQNVAQSSNTVGFKYNINQNIDFKFEYKRIKPKGDYGGFNLDAKDPFSNSNPHIYSFVVDFVF